MDNKQTIDSIQQLEHQMTAFWLRARTIDQFLAGALNIEDRVPTDLLTITDMTSLDYRYDEKRHKGKVSRPLQLRITATSGMQADMRSANAAEDVFAGKLRKAGLSLGQQVFDDVLTGMISRLCVPLQTVWQACCTPARLPDEASGDYNKRCDDYYKHWEGWRLEVDPIEAISFLPFRERITLSGRHLRMPFIDYLRQNGKYDKSSQMTSSEEYAVLANEVAPLFSHVALGTPEGQTSWKSGSSLNGYVDLWVLADDKEISYQVMGLNENGQSDRTYHEVKSLKNPLGVNPLAIACGDYQPGMPFEYRWNPLALPLERNYMMRDSMLTVLASLMNEAMRNSVQVLDGQVGAAMLGAGDETWDKMLAAIKQMPNEGQRQIAFGELASTVSPDAINLIKDNIASVTAEIGRQRPSAVVNAPPQDEAAGDMTATLGMADLAQEELGYSPLLIQLKMLAQNKLDGIWNAHRYGLNPSWEKGGKNGQITVYWRNTGQEPVAGREVEAGKSYELSPADLGFDKEVDFDLLPTDDRALGYKIQRAFQLYFTPNQVPLISYRKLLEDVGHTNVDKVMDDLTFEQLNKIETPRILDQNSQRINSYIEAEMGFAPLTLPNPAVQGPVPPTGEGGDSAPPPAHQGQTMNAPIVPQAQMAGGAG